MNYLWAFMITIGIIFAAINGTLPEVTNAALESAKEAVTLCITMAGVMSFWVGLMKIAEKSGIIGGLSKRMYPFLHFMFPNIPKNHPANKYIATNVIANVFGLGWAATPAGLAAMEALAELETERGNPAYSTEKENADSMYEHKNLKNRRYFGKKEVHVRAASNEMCTFLIINISSLQLIPVNIIAYRSQYGSVNPTEIVGPAMAATAVSTAVAVIFCKVMNSGKRRV